MRQQQTVACLYLQLGSFWFRSVHSIRVFIFAQTIGSVHLVFFFAPRAYADNNKDNCDHYNSCRQNWATYCNTKDPDLHISTDCCICACKKNIFKRRYYNIWTGHEQRTLHRCHSAMPLYMGLRAKACKIMHILFCKLLWTRWPIFLHRIGPRSQKQQQSITVMSLGASNTQYCIIAAIYIHYPDFMSMNMHSNEHEPSSENPS